MFECNVSSLKSNGFDYRCKLYIIVIVGEHDLDLGLFSARHAIIILVLFLNTMDPNALGSKGKSFQIDVEGCKNYTYLPPPQRAPNVKSLPILTDVQSHVWRECFYLS